MSYKRLKSDIGIGATNELSLRVSVATLVRVLFENPKDGELMLALERKATLLENEGGRFVEVKAQPFGGAIRIHDLKTLQDFIGDFHFDCEASRSEQDFRIFIRPSAWGTVKQYCLQHLSQDNDPVLETDPRRELVEEFSDTLKTKLKANQFTYKPVGTIVEDDPSPTENAFTRGHPTARIYRIFETRIPNTSLAGSILKSSESYSNDELRELALKDARNGGNGWANAMLALPLKPVSAAYAATSSEARNQPVSFQGHQLDETVAAVLEEILVPKYQRL